MNFDYSKADVGKAEMQEHGGRTPGQAVTPRGKRRVARRNGDLPKK